MDDTKQIVKERYVIKPRAIHVAQQFEFQVSSKQSPFSNGYDLNHAINKLGVKVTEDLDSTDPDYHDWEIYKAHELLLKKYLKDSNGRRPVLRPGEYEILPSEEARFSNLSQLSNSAPDVLVLHTRQAVRMWEGNNSKSNGRRWPGVRYGLSLSNELLRYASNDNPFAQSELMEFEADMAGVGKYFEESCENVKVRLRELATAGLNISLVESVSPVHIRLDNVRGYGFQLLQLLNSYDMFVRSVRTLMMKGIITNAAGNDWLHDGGRTLRRLLNDLYLTILRIRPIQELKRTDILDKLMPLQEAIRQDAMPALRKDVLTYEALPSLIYIPKPLDAARVKKILSVSEEYGIVV